MANTTKPQKKTATQQMIEDINQQIELGVAPWQRPWRAGEIVHPFNEISSKHYNGVNNLWLLSREYNDPRWMTYKQATSKGMQVKRGEKASIVRFCVFTEKAPAFDENGKPKLDEHGKPLVEEINLTSPKVIVYSVFNASQIKGMDAYVSIPPEWDPIKRVENLLSKLEINHNQRNAAHYIPFADKIELPARSSFASSAAYYSSALHEMAHWVHYQGKTPAEVDKLITEYSTDPKLRAKEEVTAEMTAMLLARDLYLDHIPQNDLTYMANWASRFKDEPFAIYKVAADAERRKEQILSLELKKEIAVEKAQKVSPAREKLANAVISNAKIFLAVPYKEKEEAKKLGAKWDKEAKLWYAPVGVDVAPFAKWQQNIEQARLTVQPSAAPEVEFAEFIRSMGGDIQGTATLDGKIHRIAGVGRPAGSKDFSYSGFADGVPAGWIQNFATGAQAKWVHNGITLTQEMKDELKIRAAAQRELRSQEQAATHETFAKISAKIYRKMPEPVTHPYLEQKLIHAHGLKILPQGQLVVPMVNSSGDVRSLQFIGASGFKKLKKYGEKKGNFYPLGCDTAQLGQQSKILIAEGYATAASLYEASGIPTVMAFDVNNLKVVAENIRQLAPAAEIYICADNDHARKRADGKLHNIGMDVGKLSADLIKAKLIIPQLTTDERKRGLTDFNDIRVSRGLGEVKMQLDKQFSKALNQKELAI